MKFKLLMGGHIDGDGRTYTAGKNDIIETETDLAARFGADKFARINGAEVGKNCEVWDRENETFEQFAERVGSKGRTNNAVTKAAQEGFDTAFIDSGQEPIDRDAIRARGDGLDDPKITLKQLKGLAVDEEVDTDGLTTKEQVIQAIRSQRSAKQPATV